MILFWSEDELMPKPHPLRIPVKAPILFALDRLFFNVSTTAIVWQVMLRLLGFVRYAYNV
jgi:hypothetical protein